MTHYQNVGERKISFDCGCTHPGIEENNCPTRSGNCEDCRYGKAELTISDLQYILAVCASISGKH